MCQNLPLLQSQQFQVQPKQIIVQHGVCQKEEWQMHSYKQIWIMLVGKGLIVPQFNKEGLVLNLTLW